MNSLSLSTSANADLLEEMHRAWQQNPDSVDPTWRAFFQGFTLGSKLGSQLDALLFTVNQCKSCHVLNP